MNLSNKQMPLSMRELRKTMIHDLRTENARLRGIIERALTWTKNSFNEAELINILNEAGKGNLT